ncbi:MAG TPA: hypothetical protein VIX13_06020 [Candidatus Eisenbacteria bacterium]
MRIASRITDVRQSLVHYHVLSALLVLSIFAFGLVAVGCTDKTTPIRDLRANSAGYDGKTVQVAGTVKSAAGALGYGVYQVDDGTGTIMVVTESGGAPAQGSKIGVQGVFHSAYTIGTDVLAVIVEKERRTR